MDVILPMRYGRRLRRVSSNVSAGGIYFQGHPEDGVSPGQKIGLRIAIPAGAGRMSNQGVLEGEATVLRVEPIVGGGQTKRVGVACEFCHPLRFT